MPLNAALVASQAGTPKFLSFILFLFEVKFVIEANKRRREASVVLITIRLDCIV